MANYHTDPMRRPQPTTTAPPLPFSSQSTDESSKASTPRNRNDFKLIFPFNIPPTPEATAARIIKNLAYYKFYYTVFIWSILFIALLPARKVSLIFLVVTTNVACFYLLLLRSFPNSTVLHKIVDKRLVFALLAIVTMVEMILTEAAIHFFVTLAGATPVILIHAILRVRYNLFVNEETCVGEGLVPIVYFVPFVHEKSGDVEPLVEV